MTDGLSFLILGLATAAIGVGGYFWGWGPQSLFVAAFGWLIALIGLGLYLGFGRIFKPPT